MHIITCTLWTYDLIFFDKIFSFQVGVYFINAFNTLANWLMVSFKGQTQALGFLDTRIHF